ncbi:hypothetical protein HYU20_00350 [Candidatus Woesearchaeota archaeon]|nr:hypothetical protein [Candidatus Woesearchaeota archaeon]
MAALKVFVVLVVLVAIVSSAMGAAAAADVKPTDKVVQLSRVSAFPSDSDVLVSVSLKADRKLTDAKVVVSVPELGIRSGNRVDFSKKKKQAIHIEIPIPDGLDPYMRIVFSSDEGRRVKFRPVIFQ